jgi:hypothetical protein
MAAHQRPAVVTALAIICHGDLGRAWDRAIGVDALRLEAPDDEVAFLQPPTDPPTSQQSIESADALLPGVEHEVKRSWDTTPDRAVFAIMGSMMRPNTKDHRSATRTGLSCTLTSLDGSVGAEIVNLVEAYDQLFSSRANTSSARDHMVWVRPYRRNDLPLTLADEL